jgi:hypothetical protein
MKNMQCPKCYSHEIVRLPGGITPPATLSGATPTFSFKTIDVNFYCCTSMLNLRFINRSNL